jgi:LacI family transcriptional regulator
MHAKCVLVIESLQFELCYFERSIEVKRQMSVSIRDVAKRAGVSLGTVSNVLNEPSKVASKTATKVQRAIDELGFIRNDAARQLRAGKSRSIGLIVLDVRNPFFADVARGAEDKAHGSAMSVLLASSDETKDREQQLVSLFEEQRVVGLLVSPVSSDFEGLRRVKDRGTPIVLVDRQSKDGDFCSVSVDDVAGGRMAVEHLMSQGRGRLMFAGGPLGIEQIADRLEGAQAAASKVNQTSLEIFQTEALTVTEGIKVGEAILSRDIEDRPNAIFAANDLLAIGIMQVLLGSANISIPDDICIVGYDDITFASTAMVPLSSIRQPSMRIGSQAIEMLLQEASSPNSVLERNVVFQPELVIRESTIGRV